MEDQRDQGPPPSSAAGPMIRIMPGPRMEEIASCDADGCGSARDPRLHDGEDCAGDRGELVGSDGGEPPYPHPPDASIYSPGGRGVKGDMKRVVEGYMEFLPQTDASGLRAGVSQNVDDNKNERVGFEEAPRAMEVAGMEGEAADYDGEGGIDGGDGGSPSLSMKVVLEMDTISIEANMYMEAVGAPAEAKTEMAGAHFPPPVPVAVSPSEAEERDVDNTSPELVMMVPHSNVCDERPNTNNSLKIWYRDKVAK